MELPRLELHETRDGVTIYIVDGNHVRTHLEVDFTQSAHYYSFPKLVPKDEIWLDREEIGDELKFIANHAFIERALMQQGWKYVDSLNLADRVERKERGKKRDERFLDRKPGHAELPTRLYMKRLQHLEEPGGPEVHLVNGKVVREVIDLEFVQGGHEYVYTYVPVNEVWLDNDLSPEEWAPVLLHEIVERNFMAKGMSYGRAHYFALRKEKEARLAAVKAEAEKAEAEKREADKKDTDKKETNKKETDKKEADKKETDKKETDKKETDKKETDKKETDKKETDKKETDKKETAKKDAEPRESR